MRAEPRSRAANRNSKAGYGSQIAYRAAFSLPSHCSAAIPGAAPIHHAHIQSMHTFKACTQGTFDVVHLMHSKQSIASSRWLQADANEALSSSMCSVLSLVCMVFLQCSALQSWTCSPSHHCCERRDSHHRSSLLRKRGKKVLGTWP